MKESFNSNIVGSPDSRPIETSLTEEELVALGEKYTVGTQANEKSPHDQSEVTENLPLSEADSIFGRGISADEEKQAYEKRFQIPEDASLKERLKSVQNEADQIVIETKSEIASVTENTQSEQFAPMKEKTPEELKDERRRAIIKEIEAEWESRNGPMERPLSKREIEENKYRAKAFGKEWSGFITQMTDGAREFYFDFEGMGEFSVPKRADTILAERFPEYAKTQQHEELERTRVYDSPNNDPRYRLLEKEITKRTNLDGQVMSAMQSGRDYDGVWHRANVREAIAGLDRFVRENPEKAEGYAEKWREYVAGNPEVAVMNNVQWERWCDTYGEAYSMNEYRRIARAVGQVQNLSRDKETVSVDGNTLTTTHFEQPNGVERTTEHTQPIQTQREGIRESDNSLQEVFRQANIETKKLTIEGDTEFPEAVILEKQEVPHEKLVRIFRGINHIDNSLLEQIPYAMRKENETGMPIKLEEVRSEVETLAKDPTYENLLAYSERVRPYLSSEEVARLDTDVTSVEEEILEGMSTRKSLLYKQIEHNGGWGDSGATPYISGSFDPYNAIGYGYKGLMVLDVPLSEIEEFSPDAKEVGIKGALDKKYITAVISRKISRQGRNSKDETNKYLYQTLLKVYEATDNTLLLNAEELRSMREAKSVEVAVLDKNQWKIDVAVVRQKRIKKLARKFPEIEPNMQVIQEKSNEEGVDIYTGVKRYVFDQYKSRLEKIGRNGRDITEYDFSISQYGERKKFDRESTTDIMLLKLRELVARLEEREEEREKS